MRSGFHAHVGQRVGGIAAIFSLTTDAQVLEHGVTGKCLCGNFIAGFVDVVKLYPAAIHQLLREFFRDGSISGQIRVHVLIETPRGNGVTAGFYLQHALQEPEGLTGFPEIAGTVFRHPRTVLGNLFQFALTRWITFQLRKTCRFLRVAMRKIDCRLIADNHGIVELFFFNISRFGTVQSFQLTGHQVNNTSEADFQYFAVIHTDMADTTIEIVADGKYAAGHTFFGAFRHIRCRQ